MSKHLLPEDFNWRTSEFVPDEVKEKLSDDVKLFGKCMFRVVEHDGKLKFYRQHPLALITFKWPKVDE